MKKEYKTFSKIKDNKTLCDNMITAYNHGRKYGWTQKEVAKEYGVSKYALRKVFDESDRAIFSKRIYASDLNQMFDQYQSGMKINSIAGYHGLSASTVKKHINNYQNLLNISAELKSTYPKILSATSEEGKTPITPAPETPASTPATDNSTKRIGGNNLERMAESGKGNNWRIQPTAGYSFLRTIVTAAVGVGLFVGGLFVGTKIHNHKAYDQGNKAGYSLGYNDGYNNCINNGEKCSKHKTHTQNVKSDCHKVEAKHTQKQKGKSECHDTQAQAQKQNVKQEKSMQELQQEEINSYNQKQRIESQKSCAVSSPGKTDQAEQQGGTVTVTYEHPRIIVPSQATNLVQIPTLDDILSINCRPVKKVTSDNKTLGWYVGNVFFNSSSIKDANAEYTNRKFNDVKLISEGMGKIFGNKAVIDRYELDGVFIYNLPDNEQGETGYLSIMPISGAELNGKRYLNDIRATNVHLKGFTDITKAGIKTTKITSAQFGREISSQKGKSRLHRMDKPNTNMVADVYGMQTKVKVWDGPADLGPYTVYFGQNANYFCSSDVNKAAGIGVLEGLLLFGGITQLNDGGILSNLGGWSEGPVGVGAAIVAP